MNPFKYKEWYNNKKLQDFGLIDPLNIVKGLKSQRQEKTKMTTLREQAKEYKPMKTLNVSELEEVNTEMDLLIKEGTTSDGEIFTYDYIIVKGQEYRVPKSVIKQLNAELEEKPESTKFKVKKSGSGLQTEYKVIMLD